MISGGLHFPSDPCEVRCGNEDRSFEEHRPGRHRVRPDQITTAVAAGWSCCALLERDVAARSSATFSAVGKRSNNLQQFPRKLSRSSIWTRFETQVNPVLFLLCLSEITCSSHLAPVVHNSHLVIFAVTFPKPDVPSFRYGRHERAVVLVSTARWKGFAWSRSGATAMSAHMCQEERRHWESSDC